LKAAGRWLSWKCRAASKILCCSTVTHLKQLLESDPPHGAKVCFEPEAAATGWNAPEVAPWLDDACQSAAKAVFGKPAMYMGEGGTIPFMAMLGESFPEAQFLITGVLGPKSNAHGPNEFLHLAYASKLTVVVASVLADHAQSERWGWSISGDEFGSWPSAT
jgi:hypothetical protein